LGDQPPLLFYRGDFPSNNRKSVAVAGPVAANQESIGQAVRLGRGLAERGISVITGLGKGIEASAQVGAMVTGNPGCWILSCGHEADLPEEEAALGVQIEKQGALISEYPPWTKKSPEQEAASRRLIVALAQAVLVIGTSGSDAFTEATFNLALEQGKLIFVFHPDNGAVFPAEAIHLAREEEINLLVKSLV
jgi:DNA processing protein